MANTGVPVVLRFMAEKSASLNATIGEVRKQVQEVSGDLREVSMSAGIGLGAAAAGFAAIGIAAIQTAAKFEQYEAKLNTVLKSSTEAQKVMAEAIRFAAATPFSVEGIVDATVQIEVYGQRSSEILPRVANLAAGMGKEIQGTALVVGKALSGSLEGFESLRNEYGISNAKLKQFGATLSNTGGIAINSAEDMRAARQAILSIIDTDFGGAIERQAATFSGALSNAQDAIVNLGGSLGEQLIPAATAVARGISFIGDTLNAMGDGAKSFVAWTGVAVTAGLGLGAMALTVGSQVVGLVAGLDQASKVIPALGPAVTALGTSMDFLVAKTTAAGSALAAFAISPAGLVILGLAAAAGAATYALSQFEAENKAVNAALDEQSKKSQGASQAWRGLRDAVNEAGKAQGEFVDTHRSGADTANDLAEAMKNIPALELAASLEKHGHSLESVRKSSEDARHELDQMIPKMAKLRALEEATQGAGAGVEFNLKGDFSALQELFGKTTATRAEIENMLKSQEAIELSWRNVLAYATQALPILESVNKPFADAVEHAKKLNDYLSFSKKIGDVASLQNALSAVNAEIASMTKLLADKGADTSDAGLLALVKKNPDSPDGKLAKELLRMKEEEKDLHEAMNTQAEKAASDRVKIIETRMRREKTMRDLSLQEERRYLEQELAAAKGNADQTLQIQEKLRANQKAINAKRLQDVRDNLDNMVKTELDAVEDLERAEGTTAGEVVASIDVILGKLEEWRLAHQDLLAASPELRKQYQGILEGVTDKRAGAVDKQKADNLTKLQKQIEDIFDEAYTADQQLEAVHRAVDLVNRARNSGAITAKAAQEELNRLLDQERNIREQVRREAEQRAQERVTLQAQVVDAEIAGLEAIRTAGEVHTRATLSELNQMREQIVSASVEQAQALEERLAEGDAVEEALAAKREQRYRQDVELIRLEMEAEIAAAHNSTEKIEAAREKAAAKKKARDAEERLRIQKNLQEQTAAVVAAEKKKQDEKDRSAERERQRENRKGGKKSPIMSVEEAFSGGFSLGDFSLGGYSNDSGEPGTKWDPNAKGPNELIQKGQAQKAKPLSADEQYAEAQKKSAEATEQATEATIENVEALQQVPTPVGDLATGAASAAGGLDAVATSAAAAAAALAGLGSGGGGGETPPKPTDDGKKKTGMQDPPKMKDPKMKDPAPVGGGSTSGGYPETGYPGLPPKNYPEGSKLSVPTPREMGAVARTPQAVSREVVAPVGNSETTNVVNLEGLRLPGADPDVQTLAAAAARIVEKKIERGRLMRGSAG